MKNLLLLLKIIFACMVIAFINNNCVFAQSGQKWATGGNSPNGSDFFGTNNNFPIVFKTSAMERMRLTETGNLGLGITIPTEKLDVLGNIKVSGTIFGNTISATSLNVAGLITFDSLHIIDKIKIGNSIYIGNTPNPLNASNNVWSSSGNLVVQSQSTSAYEGKPHHTIINANNDGNVGIGASNPQQKLHIYTVGTYLSPLLNTTLRIEQYVPGFSPPFPGHSIIWDLNVHGGGNFNISTPSLTTPVLTFTNAGKVGINTSSLTATLNINISSNAGIKISSDDNTGDIDAFALYNTTEAKYAFKIKSKGDVWAREVNVTMQTLPDYVFDKKYNLLPLSEVEKFINKNKHLPDVPSAKEAQANGINLGKMDATLLQKIEELTLYVIELKKENEQQQKQIKELQQKLFIK